MVIIPGISTGFSLLWRIMNYHETILCVTSVCHFSGVAVTVSFGAFEREGADAALAVVYDELTGNTCYSQGNQ
jgi:hypothetical protein